MGQLLDAVDVDLHLEAIATDLARMKQNMATVTGQDRHNLKMLCAPATATCRGAAYRVAKLMPEAGGAHGSSRGGAL